MTETAVDTGVLNTNGGGVDPLGGEPKTVLAREDALSGKLQIKGSGQVLGSFSGMIECDGDLMIGPEAHVEADVRTARITIAGFLRGNVVAATRLKIMSSGRLEGDAHVGALVVQEGGVHHGVIRVHPEGVPDSAEQAAETPARSTIVSIKQAPSPVGRVRKFWGEFF